MAILKTGYGDSNQPITITLNSLADDAARESDAVDNTSDVFQDVLVAGKLKTGAAPDEYGGSVIIYAHGTVDGGSTYTGGATGSDGGITPKMTLRVIDDVPVTDTADAERLWGPVSVGGAFGGVLPDHWGIVVENRTGDALNASNNSTWYQGVYREG